MIEIHLDSFFIGVVIGFILLMILACVLYIQDLPKEIRHGYQPIKLCKPYPPKSKKTMNGMRKEIGLPPIGSKGEDA